MTTRFTVVFNGVDVCTGTCAFCTVANEAGYKHMKDVSKRLEQTVKFDFNKLEEKVLNYPGFNENESLSVSVWGGEPLASLYNFQQLYDFFQDIGQRYSKKVAFGGSTNGIAFSDEETVEWLLSKDNIRMQLSHDGYGNWMRTGLNVLELPATERLVKHGFVNYISCVMNNLNAKPLKNVEYFNKYSYLDKVRLRLYNMRDDPYSSNFRNIHGWLNDKSYDILKGTPVGDLNIRNDESLASEYGIFQFAHQLDDFLDEYEYIYRNIDKYPRCSDVLLDRLERNWSFGSPDLMKFNRPLCAKYGLGLSDTSSTIDTLGEYTPCHLYDSTNYVILRPKLEKPERCKQCKYFKCWECNICAMHPMNDSYCQFNYRFQSLMQKLRGDAHLVELVRNYRQKRRNMGR